MYKGIQTSLRANKTKASILMLIFPIILWFVIAIVSSIVTMQENGAMMWVQAWNIGRIKASEIFIFVGPLLCIWGIVSFAFYRQIIFKFAGARPMKEDEFPEVHTIIENLCISR